MRGAAELQTCRSGARKLIILTWLPCLAAAILQANPALDLKVTVDVGRMLQQITLYGGLGLAVIVGRSSHAATALRPTWTAHFA
jgi:hypothetical protein